MGKRGPKLAARVTRGGSPNLAIGSLRATRKSAGGRMPVHFKHTTFDRSGIAAPPGDRQRYIERTAAVDIVERAGAMHNEGAAAAVGNLGATPGERTAFWTAAAKIENKNGRLQYGIIAELPHEVSPTGRFDILRRFVDDELASRSLPHWGVIHRPDAHNDPRNFHVHVLYYARPGQRTPSGTWDFTAKGPLTLEAGKYPWGTTERPSDRIRRLKRQIDTSDDNARLPEYRAALREARNYAEQARTRAPAAWAAPTPKSRITYPWGITDPLKQERRLRAQIERITDPKRRADYEARLVEVLAYQAAPPSPSSATGVNVHDRTWVKHLRDRWCEACNTVLEREGFTKRYHPGGYKDLGIGAEPTRHLGTKGAALIAQGYATPASQANTEAVLRNLLRDGAGETDIRLKSATDAAARRAIWANMEVANAQRAGRPDRLTYWTAESQAATELQAAVDAQLAAEQSTPATNAVFVGALRDILRVRSALPDIEEAAAPGTTAAPISTRYLATALLPLVAADAPEDPFNPTHMTTTPAQSPTPTPVQTAGESPTIVQPVPPTLAKPAPLPPTSTSASVVGGSNVVPPTVRSVTLPPPAIPAAPSPTAQPLFRLRPGATPGERAATASLLADRALPRLRASARANSAALSDPSTSPYEAAALRGGSELLREAIAFAETRPSERTKITKRINLRNAMRDLGRGVEAVLEAVEDLDQVMPGVRRDVTRRVKEGLTKREAASTITGSFARSVQARPENTTAVNTLRQTIATLASSRASLDTAAAADGGLGQNRRNTIDILRMQVTKAMDWIPTLPGESEAPFYAAQTALQGRTLPIRKVKLRPEHMKARRAEDARQQLMSEQQARRRAERDLTYPTLPRVRGR